MNVPLDPVTRTKLEAFARRRRRLVLRRCVSATLVTVVVSLTAVAMADLLLVLPDGVRWALSLVAWAHILGVFWILGIRAIRRSPDFRELARFIEGGRPELREDLLSAVELGAEDSDASRDSPAFRSVLQRSVAARIAGVAPEALLPPRLVRLWGILAIAGTLGFAGLFFVPDLRFGELVARAALPMANLARVSRTVVTVLAPAPPDTLVPQGDPVTVVVSCEGPEPDRVILEVSRPGKGAAEVSLDPAGKGREWSATLGTDEDPLAYRVRAGDAVTRWYTIETRLRPYVTTFDITYVPPAYMGREPRIETGLRRGDLAAFAGTRAEILLHVDQPVAEGTVEMDQGGAFARVPVERAGERILRVAIPIRADGEYKVDLRAAETGFDSGKLSPRYEIRARRDEVPVVRLDEPARDILVRADEIVDIAGGARDDVGIEAVARVFQVNDGEAVESLLARRPDFLSEPEVEVAVRAAWDLRALSLRSGDVVTVRLAAVDLKGSRAESGPVRLTVASEGFSSADGRSVAAARRALEALRRFETECGAAAGAAAPPRPRDEGPPTEGLVSRYPFDGTLDDVVSGRNGRFEGRAGSGPQFVDGHDGAARGAIRLEGAECVLVSRAVADDMTMSCWTRIAASQRRTYDGSQFWQGAGLIQGERPSMTNDAGLAVVGDRPVWGHGKPDHSIVGKTSVVGGRWVHVAAVRAVDRGADRAGVDGAGVDGAGKSRLRLYVDGVLAAEGEHSFGGPLTAHDTFSIGGHLDGNLFLRGDVDEVRFYDRALGEAEIQRLARPGGAASEGAAPAPPPVAPATDAASLSLRVEAASQRIAEVGADLQASLLDALREVDGGPDSTEIAAAGATAARIREDWTQRSGAVVAETRPLDAGSTGLAGSTGTSGSTGTAAKAGRRVDELLREAAGAARAIRERYETCLLHDEAALLRDDLVAIERDQGRTGAPPEDRVADRVAEGGQPGEESGEGVLEPSREHLSRERWLRRQRAALREAEEVARRLSAFGERFGGKPAAEARAAVGRLGSLREEIEKGIAILDAGPEEEGGPRREGGREPRRRDQRRPRVDATRISERARQAHQGWRGFAAGELGRALEARKGLVDGVPRLAPMLVDLSMAAREAAGARAGGAAQGAAGARAEGADPGDPRASARASVRDLLWSGIGSIARTRAAIEDARADSDPGWSSDLGLLDRALKALRASGDEERILKALEAIPGALRTLEAGHDLVELVALVDAMRSAERWSFGSPASLSRQPERSQWSIHLLHVVPGRIREAGFPKEAAERLERLRGSGGWQEVGRQMDRRRWSDDTPVRMDGNLARAAEELGAAKALLREEMAKARKILEDCAPSLSEMMAGLAERAEAMEEKIRDVAEAPAGDAPTGEVPTGEAPTAETPTAETPSPEGPSPEDLAGLLADQAALSEGVGDLVDALRRDANLQDTAAEAGRERARDADDAAAMVSRPTREAERALQESALASEPAARSAGLGEAAGHEEALADTLRDLAEHYGRMERGEDVASSRAALREAEERLGIAETLDREYAAAADLAGMQALSPEELLAALEAELGRNPEMQRELTSISRGALADARSALEGASSEETRIAEGLRESIRGAEAAPSLAAAARGAERQGPIGDDVGEAGETIGRAARHEERLGNEGAGEALAVLADGVRGVAEAEVPAAGEALREGGPEPGQRAVETARDAIDARIAELDGLASSAATSGAPGQSPGEPGAEAGAPGSAAAGAQPGAQPGARTGGDPSSGSPSPGGDGSPLGGETGEALAHVLDHLDRAIFDRALAAVPGAGEEGASASAPGDAAGAALESASGLLGEASASQAQGMRQGRGAGTGLGMSPGESPSSEGFSPVSRSGARVFAAASGVGAIPALGARAETRPWGKLPPKLARDLMEGQRERVAEEYRAMVEAYFRAIAERARKESP